MRAPLTLALLALALWAQPGAAQRTRYSMDPGWRFTLGDPAGAEAVKFDDAGWRQLDLPHDWSIESEPKEDAPGGGRVGFYPGGVGWYRKAFRTPANSTGKDFWLEFDGAYMNSEVWINGVRLGKRPFGYISFMYDITPHMVSGVNVIAVRIDNSAQPNSRWYTGSGIYRHVWLTMVDRLRVGHWGTWVTTEGDSARATVKVTTRVENNHYNVARSGTLRTVVLDAAGKEIDRAESPFTLGDGVQSRIEQSLQVAAPRLWSPESPNRYQLRSEVIDKGKVLDAVVTPFGIRSIKYDKDRGFLLNGNRVKMRGVNLHHDGGAVGAAVPERIWINRLVSLKAMGVNAIRTSHNPPAPEFLDLCDSLGFLVMAEAFDEWTFGKVPEGYHKYFKEWSERDVTDFVHRDRNHPSIVLWSAGNEIGEQGAPEGDKVLRGLLEVFHREDPTRPVTTGNDNIVADGGPARLEFLNALDIVGYNYVDRWHERREIFAEPDRHDHPEWLMIGTESGSIFQSFDEQYSLGDDSTVVKPNYNSAMLQAERLWKWITMRDYFSGNFMWTGVDYLGEAVWPFRGFPSGTLDLTGRPKDAYYLYQSLWTREPVLRLFPHWNWPGREGQVIPVLAYSNCNSVELFLNGKSLGEKRMEFPAQGTSGGWNTYAEPVVRPTTNDLHVSWDVPYQPGVLRAVGKRRDGTIACEAEVATAGGPAAIRLKADRDTITTWSGDVSLIQFEVVDAQGRVVPTASNPVRVAVSGGTLVALDNANLKDLSLNQSDQRQAFNGRGLAIVRGSKAGTIRVRASSPGLTDGDLTLTVRTGANPPAIPSVWGPTKPASTRKLAGEGEVFYQIFVRSFRDSDGDRIGDLRGIEEKLGYLEGLGVTSVLLTPINPSPFYHNYFGSNFEGVDPAFGDMNALIGLTKAIHRRRMKLYLDQEIQYVTADHPWWVESDGKPESQYSKFVLYNGPGNTQPETGVFGLSIVPMWDGTRVQIATVNMLDPGVGKYFQDLFARMIDPNGDGRFDDGVDGFRIDHMMDDLDLKGKQKGLFANFWAGVFARARQVNPTVKIIAEQFDWGYGEDFLTRGGVDMVFAFPLRGAIVSFKAADVASVMQQTIQRTPPGKGQLVFIENHDMNRFASEVDGDLGKEKLGAALNLLLKGTPLIYYGQEIGMRGRQNKSWGTDANDIPVREAFEWVRKVDGPMDATWYRERGPWWTERYARDDDGISFEEENTDPNSLLSYYRKLGQLRHTRGELVEGDQRVLTLDTPNTLGVVRSRGSQWSVLLVNFADAETCIALKQDEAPDRWVPARMRDLLSGGHARTGKGECIVLPAFGVRLLTP